MKTRNEMRDRVLETLLRMSEKGQIDWRRQEVHHASYDSAGEFFARFKTAEVTITFVPDHVEVRICGEGDAEFLFARGDAEFLFKLYDAALEKAMQVDALMDVLFHELCEGSIAVVDEWNANNPPGTPILYMNEYKKLTQGFSHGTAKIDLIGEPRVRIAGMGRSYYSLSSIKVDSEDLGDDELGAKVSS